MIDKSVMMILHYLAIAILFFEFLFVSHQKPSEIQKHGIVLTLSTLVMFVGYNIELSADCLETALAGTAVSYMGKPFVMLASFLFICAFYRLKIPRIVELILSVICTSFSILVFSNERHHLYYATSEFDPNQAFSGLINTRGPLYYSYVFTAVAYFLACLFIIFKRSRLLKDKKNKLLSIYIILMVCSGIGGYLIYLADLTGSYDGTMTGVFFGVIFLFILFVRGRIFDADIVGKDQALEDSTTGLVIFDFAGQLSYQNSVVATYLDENITLDFLRTLTTKYYKYVSGGRALTITTKPIEANGAYLGKSVEISDVTEFHDYQARLEHDVKERTEKLAMVQRKVIGSVASIIEARSVETGEHIVRCSQYAVMIAKRLQEKNIYTDIIDDSFIDLIDAAAPMHDVGKISVPDHILLKPGTLTPEEFEAMKTHVSSGAQIIESSLRGVESDDYVAMAKDIAQFHHEWWDGNGYLMGLKGEEIPLSARILAVADCFDALTSERCYKSAFSFEKSIEIIESESGTHFDPQVVDAFLEAIQK